MDLMTIPLQQVRRATVEDLAKLLPLWKQENLPWADLEKRFKEFQVVEGPSGEVLGALGLQISGQEGRLHSEVFVYPEQSDALRTKLWERIQILANNHGLVRIWTQLATPFWHSNGFQRPSADAQAKLPGAFASAPQPWLCLPLKDDTGPAVSLDKEFALFKEAEKERTDKIFRTAKVLKMVAFAISILVVLLVTFWAILFFKARKPRSEIFRPLTADAPQWPLAKSHPRGTNCAPSDRWPHAQIPVAARARRIPGTSPA